MLEKWLLAIASMALVNRTVAAQTTPLLKPGQIAAIRDESSGERALSHFRFISGHYSGFTPSAGGDQVAQYLAGRARANGLTDVGVEGFPADGRRFFWTFLTEPAWEAESGTLTMVAPRNQLLADFSALPVSLGRFSTTQNVTAPLVDVGSGAMESDYRAADVRGKLVLVSGEPGAAHALAVWGHGAVGIVSYRPRDATEPLPLVSNPTLVPWNGPDGQAPGVAFGIPYAVAAELKELLRRGTPVSLHAAVRATTGAGQYQQVSGVIPGTDPTLPEVWVNAHDNFRNTGGGNNLTGVGATVEISRVLAQSIARGSLARPRRTIRFLWGAEHYSSIYNLFTHPERKARILTFLNVDMVGYHQERAKSVFHVYRTPNSLPHFINDVAEELITAVGRANTETVREAAISSPGLAGEHDPVFAPTGSRDQLHYSIEDFWGPSDHEDVVALGVPAVLYNDWPDPWIGTQEDNLDRADPTQMRRAVITIAATAYYLAGVGPAEAPRLSHLVTAGAEARLARDARRAFELAALGSGAEATNLLEQAWAREKETIRTIAAIGDGPEVRGAVEQAERPIAALHAANLAAVGPPARATAVGGGSKAKAAATEPADSARLWVPTRVDSIKGPVHFFRPEYGVAWLRVRTANEDPASLVTLARRGHYVLFEALNFADGRRTMSEIRNAVSAEYGAIPVDEFVEYFQLLKKVGVVTIGRPGASSR